MAVYVLVHGAGHGGWCYQRVARMLRAEGHEVHTPTLTGVAERSHALFPGIGLDTHVRDIAELLHYEDLRDVILVGHSYGGMVVTGAADRAADRVGRLVYLDAPTPTRNGQSLLELAGPSMAAVRPHGQVIDGVELVLLPVDGIATAYGVTDPDDIAWMGARLTGHPWACIEQPLQLGNEDALWAIPRYQVVCTSRLAAGDYQQVIDRARAEGRLWCVDTGHDLMMTEPRATADALLAVAAAA